MRSDNFNRADSTTSLDPPSDGGAGYGITGGTWGITANKGYRVDTNNTFEVAWLEANTPNARCSVKFPQMGDDLVVVARLTDSANFLYYKPLASGGGIWKRQAGSNSSLVAFSTTPVAGDLFDISVDASNLITAYQNGFAMGSVTNAFNATATKFGLHITDTIGALNSFDDLSITDLGATNLPGQIWL